MIKGDMEQKRRLSKRLLEDIIREHHGTTIAFTGMPGDDARVALAAVEAGAKFLEPNHGDHSLAFGFKGVKNMHDTVAIRDLMPVSEMARVVEGVRGVVGKDIFICVGAPGAFTSPLPVVFTEEMGIALSRAGANGLHVHKSTFEDLKDIVDIAHYCGLLVDAYIGHPEDKYLFGVPAESPQDVADTARKMRDIGVDMIGLMTGMSYQGEAAGEINPSVRERLVSLVKAVDVPTIAEGGINVSNFRSFIDLGVNILVIGTSINDVIRNAVGELAAKFLARD